MPTVQQKQGRQVTKGLEAAPMKFYKRFPGDINIKTGHLTMAEFGAYDRLLDHYYATETPLPAHRCYGIARALTPADRTAVDRVLVEFFRLTDAGWEQQRADEMIAEALPRIEAARENGKRGGRPKGSVKKPSGFLSETQSETKGVDSEKAIQSHMSSPSSKTVSKASPSHPPKGEHFAEFWEAWPRNERKQDKAKSLEHWTRHNLDAIAETILADVRTKRATTKWLEGYIEAPLIYMRGRRWEDGVEPDGGNPSAAIPTEEAAKQADATQAYLAKLNAHKPSPPPANLRKVHG